MLNLFTILSFIITNFLILFFVKTRTTIVISLIISHLFAALFFSISISDYNFFKEIVLALILYSMVILFLISNYNPNSTTEDQATKIDFSFKNFLSNPFKKAAVFLTILSILFLSLSIIKNISPITKMVQKEKFLSSPKVRSDSLNNQKKKLSDNFLLKRSSDVILIIISAIFISLILSPKQPDKT